MTGFKLGLFFGCLLALILIFLGYVIRDSIRVGVVSECITNKKIVVYSTEYHCSLSEESK